MEAMANRIKLECHNLGEVLEVVLYKPIYLMGDIKYVRVFCQSNKHPSPLSVTPCEVDLSKKDQRNKKRYLFRFGKKDLNLTTRQPQAL